MLLQQAKLDEIEIKGDLSSSYSTAPFGNEINPKLETYTPYPVENFSVGRLLLIGAFQDQIQRPEGPKPDIFQEFDYEHFYNKVQRRVAKDWFCASNSLEHILEGIHREVGEPIKNFKEEANTVNFKNAYDYFSFLAKSGVELPNGPSLEEMTQFLSKNEESLRNNSLEMTLFDLRDISNEVAFATVRTKSMESLGLKMLERYSRLINITDEEINDPKNGLVVGISVDGKEVGESNLHNYHLTNDELLEFVFGSYLPDIFSVNDDYYLGSGRKKINYIVVNREGSKVEFKLNGNLNSIIDDFFLVDDAGFRVTLKKDSSFAQKMENEYEDDTSKLEQSLRDRLGKNYLLMKERFEPEGYFTREKDATVVFGIGGIRENQSMYAEGRIQREEDLFIGEFGSDRSNLRSHEEYKTNIRNGLVDKLDNNPWLRQTLYRLSKMLKVQPEDITMSSRYSFSNLPK